MNKNKDIRYFNFPIALLENFLIDTNDVLINIVNYAIYVKCEEYKDKEGFSWTYDYEIEKSIRLAESYFNITTINKVKGFENGEILFNSLDPNLPKVGLNIDILIDFNENDKTEFEKVCLLAFIAIKSILQNKAYCKIDNKFWFSRMSGKAKSVNEISEISPELFKYFNEYQQKKIKAELINNWGLIHYSRYTRGFYVSFKLTLDKLIYQAEKRRKTTLEKQRKEREKVALKKAIKMLNTQPP